MNDKKRKWELFDVLKFIKPYKLPYIIGIIGMDFVGTATIVLLAYALKYTIEIQQNAGSPAPVFFIYICLGVTFLCIPFTFYIYQKAAKKAVLDVKFKLIKKIQSIHFDAFEGYLRGDVLTRATTDMESLEKIYTNLVQTLSGTIFLGAGTVVFMLVLEWRISFFLLITSLITAVISRKLTAVIGRLQEEITAREGRLINRIMDTFDSFFAMKLFGHMRGKSNGIELTQDIYKISRRMGTYKALLNGVNYMAGTVNFVGAMCICAFFVIGDSTELGTVIALIVLQMNISTTFVNIGDIITDLSRTLIGAKRIIQIFELPEEEALQEKEAFEVQDVGQLTCQDIFFGWENKELLKEISLCARKGELTVLTGPSGCGKSTLIKLLLRYYDAHSGDIAIGGQSVYCSSVHALRSSVAYMPQHNFLFQGTIRENIMCGNQTATIEEFLSVSKAAGVDKFVEAFPDQYETVVEEGGANLSEGQCQKISLARTFLKKASILILDEPTAYLDAVSESHIMNSLKERVPHSIILIVTHKAIVIRKSDKIYMMQDARIVEEGSYEKLLNENGYYADFFKTYLC